MIPLYVTVTIMILVVMYLTELSEHMVLVIVDNRGDVSPPDRLPTQYSKIALMMPVMRCL